MTTVFSSQPFYGLEITKERRLTVDLAQRAWGELLYSDRNTCVREDHRDFNLIRWGKPYHHASSPKELVIDDVSHGDDGITSSYARIFQPLRPYLFSIIFL